MHMYGSATTGEGSRAITELERVRDGKALIPIAVQAQLEAATAGD
jgi:hypothetical protein